MNCSPLRRLRGSVRIYWFASLALLWILVWATRWADALHHFPWLRMGIALLIFAAPGVLVSLLLMGSQFSLLGHLSGGIAVSVLFVGALGFMGRAFHLSFALIRPTFVLFGLVALLLVVRQWRLQQQLYRPEKPSILTIFLLVAMIAFGIVLNLQSRFRQDDFSYLAYLTTWQHGQPLNFGEVVFGSGQTDSIRFWLAMFPMSLAFLSEISKLHGLLLIGLYLEPYLIGIGLLTGLFLYKEFSKSEHQAVAGLLLQVTMLFILGRDLQPGTAFFTRLSEDKVFATFILAPIFFVALHRLIESFTLRNGIFTLLVGLSVALTHPIVLAFSVFIGGMYAAVTILPRKRFKEFVIIAAGMLTMVMPSALLRFINLPWVSRYIFHLDSPVMARGVFDLDSALHTFFAESRISYIAGTPFYGFNLRTVMFHGTGVGEQSLLQLLYSWSYVLILALGFTWSLFYLKKHAAAPFILAVSLLVLLCAIPYTGWLLGYFVSARMLWRSAWLLQNGLVLVLLLDSVPGTLSAKILSPFRGKISARAAMLALVLALSAIVLVYFSTHLYGSRWRKMARNETYRAELTHLSALGDYLEEHITEPSRFIAPANLMDYLPGLSSKSKVPFFRTLNFTRNGADSEEVSKILSLDKSIPVQQRMNLLKKYHVKYIVMADSSLQNYYSGYPDFFSARKVESFWVIEFHGPS